MLNRILYYIVRTNFEQIKTADHTTKIGMIEINYGEFN